MYYIEHLGLKYPDEYEIERVLQTGTNSDTYLSGNIRVTEPQIIQDKTKIKKKIKCSINAKSIYHEHIFQEVVEKETDIGSTQLRTKIISSQYHTNTSY